MRTFAYAHIVAREGVRMTQGGQDLGELYETGERRDGKLSYNLEAPAAEFGTPVCGSRSGRPGKPGRRVTRPVSTPSGVLGLRVRTALNTAATLPSMTSSPFFPFIPSRPISPTRIFSDVGRIEEAEHLDV